MSDVTFFYKKNRWLAEVAIQDANLIFGDGAFANGGGLAIEDYRPTKTQLIADKGIAIGRIPFAKTGLKISLKIGL